MIGLATHLQVVLAYGHGERVAKVEGASWLIEHSGIAEVSVSINGNSGSTTGCPALCIGNTGKTVGNAAHPKRGWRNRAHSKWHTVAFVAAPAKPKLIQHGRGEGVGPADGTRVIASSRNRLPVWPKNDVIVKPRAVVCVKSSEHVVS